MKLGQLIAYYDSDIFEAGTLVPDLFVFKKALYKVKASGLLLSFDIF